MFEVRVSDSELRRRLVLLYLHLHTSRIGDLARRPARVKNRVFLVGVHRVHMVRVRACSNHAHRPIRRAMVRSLWTREVVSGVTSWR
jgi:hypothetical protein